MVLLGFLFLFNIVFYYAQLGAQGNSLTARTPLSYSGFVNQVRDGNVRRARVQGTEITGDLKRHISFRGKSYGRFVAVISTDLTPSTVSLMQRHGVDISVADTATPVWAGILGLFLQGLPLLFLLGLFFYGARSSMRQQQGIFGFGQSRAKLYTEERPMTTFADVAGVEGAKGELREIVDFLLDPSKYHLLGARIPKGVLLVGPPGTGKTLLARAVAGEARVAFFSISATEFVEMFVGVGASRVRDLFVRARQAAPSIVFVDELDAIGGQRSARGPMGGGSNDEREQTLNQLLVSMDGFEPNDAVIVLAATNRPDVLDPALLRPGRFDRQVEVDPPDRQGREAVLKIHTRKIPLSQGVDLETIARATPGMSGADLANLANEAALAAARRGESEVSPIDFDQALDRITLGLEGAPLMDEVERRTVAYHEGGHALMAFLLPNVDPVNRITITPRGRSLGVTQFLPVDERRNYRRDYLLNRMAVGLGGRAAEELVFEEITSGAQNDLQQVTSIARAMVTQLGMADELGPIYYGGSADGALGSRPYNPFEPKEYSDETGHRIDQAVGRLVTEAHNQAVEALRRNREALDAIAAALLHDESLDRDQFTAIASTHGAQAQHLPSVENGPPSIGVDASDASVEQASLPPPQPVDS
ncbi:MAG: ATP-dependent zinc metalloprotease FtsH [Chloroflexota bacterium]